MFNVPFGITRYRRLLWVGIAALALPLLLLIGAGQELHSQEGSVTEISSDSYQFAGRIDQDGFDFAAYGYIYDIEGVAPAELFSDSNPLFTSETTAHFTYYASAELTSRAVMTDTDRAIFALDSVGEIVYYYQESPSASFDDPQSFAQGTPVMTATIRLQDILTVTGPDRGLAVGNGKLSVLSAEPFTFGGETVRFGRPGKSYQISTQGDAVRTDAQIPQSSVLLAGDAISVTWWQNFLPIVE
ncbi:MAG TPA: hypothetical protein VK879_02255 [Candidatus Sulfomarinibacteraceae bacterium]|nr:hypothetical protein [Candidatus Sulfomarinibacteraceae bacterium]